MKIQSRLYISYLLRMWQVEEASRLVWRASLENPRTGEILYFASLPRLFQFLEKCEGMRESGSTPPNAEGGNK